MGRRLRSAPFFIRASGSHATSKSPTFGIELGPGSVRWGFFLCASVHRSALTPK